MKEPGDESVATGMLGLNGHKPALQVICLGSGGGPCEDNVTSFLVRSTGNAWSRGSIVAVDAGSHLGPITRILEHTFPSSKNASSGGSANGDKRATGAANGNVTQSEGSPDSCDDDDQLPTPEPTVMTCGPFAGLKLPHETARANALYLLRNYISTYLITHPHLDHVSGFAINTAAFHATSRPKTLAALPSTVDALKQHIFNDVIWPNLTDEDGGVGFVTFQRLKEGGDAMLGEGEGRGYIDVCDGLGVRSFKVSHGVCTKSPPSHHHRGSIASIADQQQGLFNGASQDLPNTAMARSFSISAHHSGTGTPGGARQNFHQAQASPHIAAVDNGCVVDSTAYFIRDMDSQREVLIFGDVEPDSISLSPRNHIIWQEAAHKIAHGLLGGILIECSYDDSQADAYLFGHLNPKHLIAELQNLAAAASEAKAARALERAAKKRKRSVYNGMDNAARALAPAEDERKRSRSLASRAVLAEERRRSSSDFFSTDGAVDHNTASPSSSLHEPHLASDGLDGGGSALPASPKTVSFPRSMTEPGELPLSGIRIVIIHVKDTFKDGPHVSESILAQLQEHEQRLRDEGQGLGCEFVISQSGESYWF